MLARPRGTRPGSLGDIERALTELHAEAVDRSCAPTASTSGRQIDLIGYHGQTVLHDARAAR